MKGAVRNCLLGEAKPQRWLCNSWSADLGTGRAFWERRLKGRRGITLGRWLKRTPLRERIKESERKI